MRFTWNWLCLPFKSDVIFLYMKCSSMEGVLQILNFQIWACAQRFWRSGGLLKFQMISPFNFGPLANAEALRNLILAFIQSEGQTLDPITSLANFAFLRFGELEGSSDHASPLAFCDFQASGEFRSTWVFGEVKIFGALTLFASKNFGPLTLFCNLSKHLRSLSMLCKFWSFSDVLQPWRYFRTFNDFVKTSDPKRALANSH